MKNVCTALLAIVFLLISFSLVGAQEYGVVRALTQRGEHVVRQKNDFVSRVLTSYAIRHELNAQGALIRIYIEDNWLDISAVEIVPVLKAYPDKTQQVAAHQLFFFTDDGILNLISELIIR